MESMTRKHWISRLEDYKRSGVDIIDTFNKKITESLVESLSNAMIDENKAFSDDIVLAILSYSHHKQVIEKWYTICDKLGPFSSLISMYKNDNFTSDWFQGQERQLVRILVLNCHHKLEYP